MFIQTKWDIGVYTLCPDFHQEVVTAVRVTAIEGKIEEAYLLANHFVWCTIQELWEINNGKQI